MDIQKILLLSNIIKTSVQITTSLYNNNAPTLTMFKEKYPLVYKEVSGQNLGSDEQKHLYKDFKLSSLTTFNNLMMECAKDVTLIINTQNGIPVEEAIKNYNEVLNTINP